MTPKLIGVAVVGIVAAFEWRQFAEDAGRIGALIAVAGVIAKTKPIRFVFRRLVAEPYWQAHGHKTREVVDEVVAPLAQKLEQVEAVVVEHDRKTDERARWQKPTVATELWDGNDFPAGDVPPLQNPWEG